MPLVTFRLYGPLNDFLPPSRRHASLVCECQPRANVKDAIEALGVPHPEIDLILVNGTPRPFGYLLQPGDRVAVYPAFHGVDLPHADRLSLPLAEPRFVADVHLGRLAAYLRLLGFDVAYRNDFADAELAALSAREDRVLLTRDVGLLKRSIVSRGCFLRETTPGRQVREVVRRFDLGLLARPFSRCLRCNTALTPVPKARVEALVPPRSRERFHDFSRCGSCGRVYWPGTHYERMQHLVGEVLGSAGSQGHAW